MWDRFNFRQIYLKLQACLADTSGVTMIETGIIVGTAGILIGSAVFMVGDDLGDVFKDLLNAFDTGQTISSE